MHVRRFILEIVDNAETYDIIVTAIPRDAKQTRAGRYGVPAPDAFLCARSMLRVIEECGHNTMTRALMMKLEKFTDFCEGTWAP